VNPETPVVAPLGNQYSCQALGVRDDKRAGAPKAAPGSPPGSKIEPGSPAAAPHVRLKVSGAVMSGR
jgi:hypothetical protein